MTFGTTSGEQLTMAASANIFYVTIDYKNKTNLKVAASNINIKQISCFLNSRFLVIAWPLYSGKSHDGTWNELAID